MQRSLRCLSLSKDHLCGVSILFMQLSRNGNLNGETPKDESSRLFHAYQGNIRYAFILPANAVMANIVCLMAAEHKIQFSFLLLERSACLLTITPQFVNVSSKCDLWNSIS